MQEWDLSSVDIRPEHPATYCPPCASRIIRLASDVGCAGARSEHDRARPGQLREKGSISSALQKWGRHRDHSGPPAIPIAIVLTRKTRSKRGWDSYLTELLARAPRGIISFT